MARLDELDEYLDPGLILTVRGREYTVPLPSAELGLWLQRIAQAAPDALTAADSDDPDLIADVATRAARIPTPEIVRDRTLTQIVLGDDLHAQMIADGVPYPHLEHCGRTALWWILAGEQAAAAYWASGGRPEVWRPANRKARRAKKPKG